MSDRLESDSIKLREYIRQNKLRSVIVFILIMLLGLMLYWAIRPGAAPAWTGFNQSTGSESQARTLWNWLELLLIPITLLFIAWWLRRAVREINVEMASAEQSQHALEIYLEQITNLILVQNLPDSQEGDEVRTVARALTSSVLRNIDPSRKGHVIEFLYESSLLDVRDPVVGLHNFDLIGADLREFNLKSVSLQGSDLRSAKMNEIDLDTSDLRGTRLDNADLSQAQLQEVYLRDAGLRYANLAGAQMPAATLAKSIMIGADLRGANLEEANLTHADLTGADLTGANLRGAKMRGVVFCVGQCNQVVAAVIGVTSLLV